MGRNRVWERRRDLEWEDHDPILPPSPFTLSKKYTDVCYSGVTRGVYQCGHLPEKVSSSVSEFHVCFTGKRTRPYRENSKSM